LFSARVAVIGLISGSFTPPFWAAYLQATTPASSVKTNAPQTQIADDDRRWRSLTLGDSAAIRLASPVTASSSLSTFPAGDSRPCGCFGRSRRTGLSSGEETGRMRSEDSSNATLRSATDW